MITPSFAPTRFPEFCFQLLPQCDKIGIMDGGRMVYFGPFSIAAINRYLPSPANSLLEDVAKEAGSDSIAEETFRKSSIQRQSTLSSARLESVKDIVIPGEKRSESVGFRPVVSQWNNAFWTFGGYFFGSLSTGEMNSRISVHKCGEYPLHRIASISI
jgi:hypothetical protein